MSLNQCILFEDIFEVSALNENGKKFERGTLDTLLLESLRLTPL